MKPWDGIIPPHEQEAYRAAGFGRRTGLGARPALLIIDVQYRTVGTEPRPFCEAIKEFPTACGQVGWDAVHHIARAAGAVPRQGLAGALSLRLAEGDASTRAGSPTRCRRMMTVARTRLRLRRPGGAGAEGDVLLPKKHPSAFFGTPLASYLVERGVDTLVVTGCTTSGCVRGTVVDGFAYNFRCPRAARVRVRPQPGVARRQPVRHVGEIRRRDEHRRGAAGAQCGRARRAHDAEDGARE